MAHHAYLVAGDIEEGVSQALAHVEHELGLPATGNPDVTVLRHGLFSVDDARKLRALAELAPSVGEHKALIVSASRLFHEAQNALLKLFEEPPAGTTLILVLPSEGMLLPTLRSRLLPLPGNREQQSFNNEVQEFLKAKSAEREKILEKILNRTKSDRDEEKQSGRLQALRLLEGLSQAAYAKWQSEKAPAKRKDIQLFLDDLNAFIPILHERSAPLKLIFEHISLTLPAGL
jgi:DNA polymerase III delta prime subunit